MAGSNPNETPLRAVAAWAAESPPDHGPGPAKTISFRRDGVARAGRYRRRLIPPATTQADLANASGDLAAAMQQIGLGNWPRFLRDIADRAEASAPAPKPVVLAQAAMPNTATDAQPAATPGRYIADNPRQWIGKPSVGTGECVPLVRAATGAPQAKTWRQGAKVQGNMDIKPGTAIATFDSHGHYEGHAAIYLGQGEKGIQVIDQWNIRDPMGHISKPNPPSERSLEFGKPKKPRVDRGESYYVVE